ncbi:hypothetical protein CYMTET_25950, partial [Cymbomonas tetramitiformis]
ACYVMSPWVDLTISVNDSEDSWQTNTHVDYLGFAGGNSPYPMIFDEGGHWLENLLTIDPALVRRMPPVLMQCGDKEVLFSEIHLFRDLFQQHNETDCHLEVYADMVHVFQFFLDIDRNAQHALKSAGNFLKRRIPVDDA